jgi:hypothetical protein
MTAILGIVGAIIASYLGQALGWYAPGEGAGLIGAVVGAINCPAGLGYDCQEPRCLSIDPLNLNFFQWRDLSRHKPSGLDQLQARFAPAGTCVPDNGL